MRIQLRALVPMRRIAAAVMALASGLVIVSAQSSDTFVPVTDAMLEAPAPGDWLTWRRDPGRLGLQPPRSDRPRQRAPAPDGLVARARAGAPGGDAARLRRRLVHAAGERRHRCDRRGHRRPEMAASPRPARRYLRPRGSERRHQPEHRHLRPLHHQHQRRRLRLRTRRRDGRAGLGDADLRLHGDLGPAQLRTDHRRRQGDLRAQLRPARGVRNRGARRPHRGGAVAAPDDSGPGRAGRRDLGRRAVRGTPPRRHLDAPQLRPRAAPSLPGHIGDGAGPEVHARRRRQSAPLPQLDLGPRSAPSTTRPARSSGRSTSARRSPASRSATRSTAGSTSRSAPVTRERRGPSPPWPRSCVRAAGTTCSCSLCLDARRLSAGGRRRACDHVRRPGSKTYPGIASRQPPNSRSSTAATSSAISSSPGRATICTDSGRPSPDRPSGTATPGR